MAVLHNRATLKHNLAPEPQKFPLGTLSQHAPGCQSHTTKNTMRTSADHDMKLRQSSLKARNKLATIFVHISVRLHEGVGQHDVRLR